MHMPIPDMPALRVQISVSRVVARRCHLRHPGAGRRIRCPSHPYTTPPMHNTLVCCPASLMRLRQVTTTDRQHQLDRCRRSTSHRNSALLLWQRQQLSQERQIKQFNEASRRQASHAQRYPSPLLSLGLSNPVLCDRVEAEAEVRRRQYCRQVMEENRR